MDTNTFLLARQEIQDRLELRRQQIAQDKENEQSHWTLPIGQVLGWIHDHTSPSFSSGLVKGLLSLGLGWVLPRFLPRTLIRTPRRGFVGRMMDFVEGSLS